MYSAARLFPLALVLVVASPANGGDVGGDVGGRGSHVLKVRVFWARHGLSCANVLHRAQCTPPSPMPGALMDSLDGALRGAPGGRFANASLSRAYGVTAGTEVAPDCTVQIDDGRLVPGESGKDGAVVRLHHLCTDPQLTDCSRHQSVFAGRALLQWMRRAGVRLDFVGSSTLMRAFETAGAMFLQPCAGDDAVNCSGVVDSESKIAPLPYLSERTAPGSTALQADNTPWDLEEQRRIVEATYGRPLPIDGSYATGWPRGAQQYEKFKAFLATQILPKLQGGNGTWPAAPAEAFRAAMDATLPETTDHADHGKAPISFAWEGGSYATGREFVKAEYQDLSAPEVNIAIVGHSNFMLQYCLEGRLPKPNNNAVFEKLFVLEASAAEGANGRVETRTLLRELAGECAMVMDAPTAEASISDLVGDDIATCTSPFDISKFVRLGAASGGRGASGATACASVAEAEDAFPIQPDFDRLEQAGEL